MSVKINDGARKGVYEKDLNPNAVELFDQKLRLQVDISFRRQHGFMRSHGLNECNRVLDIGTGNGYFLCRIANEHPDIRFTGTDFKADALVKSRTTAQNNGTKNVDWQVLDITRGALPPNHGQFDGILMRYTDTHIPNIVAAVSNMAKMLRHGGRIWIFSVDLDLTYSRPDDPIYVLYKEGTLRFYNNQRMDPFIAKKMPDILTSNGFGSVVTEPDTMSNKDMGGEMFEQFMVNQAVLFGDIDPTSFSQDEIDKIKQFACTRPYSPDFYGTHGVVMISAVKK